MSNQSMASGDPYCPVHGFTPCRCWQFSNLYTAPISMIQQSAFPNCGGCGKPQATCMCSGSSDPWADLSRLQGKLPEGVSISVDVTKPQEDKPVKKWADELREVSQKVNENPPPDGFSLYIYLLERCKIIAKHGDFSTVFWKNRLTLWNKEELEIAAELLRKDDFKVELYEMNDDIRIHVSWA